MVNAEGNMKMENFKRRTSDGSGGRGVKAKGFDETTYNKCTSIHSELTCEYTPLEIIKLLFYHCGDPRKLSPLHWSAQEIKDFNIFFDSLAKLDKITKEIFGNLYCKTKLNREWFQEKNSILCVILEQFNEFIVRSMAPLGTKEFNLADLLLLGTTQRIFKFLLIQNYRENNISELTQWFSKMTQIKEFKQTFGVAKFCVGSIDDLYQFNGSSRDNSRKRRNVHEEDRQVPESQEDLGRTPEGKAKEIENFEDDESFSLAKFKAMAKNYLDPENSKAYSNADIVKNYLENFDDAYEVFVMEDEQDEPPEEGLSGFNFISKFQDSKSKDFFFYIYLYKERLKRTTIGRRESDTSDHENFESDTEKGYHELLESANQSERSEQDDEDYEDQTLMMKGLLISKKCEELREIREGVMMVFQKFEGLQARVVIEKSLLKNNKSIVEHLII